MIADRHGVANSGELLDRLMHRHAGLPVPDTHISCSGDMDLELLDEQDMQLWVHALANWPRIQMATVAPGWQAGYYGGKHVTVHVAGMPAEVS